MPTKNTRAVPKRTKTEAAKPKATAPKHDTAPQGRPYLLDSSLVLSEINRHREAAMAEIDAIDVDMLSIQTTANNDITLIRARAEAEINARMARREDLQKILLMTGAPPADAPDNNTTLQAAIEHNRLTAEDKAPET